MWDFGRRGLDRNGPAARRLHIEIDRRTRGMMKQLIAAVGLVALASSAAGAGQATTTSDPVKIEKKAVKAEQRALKNAKRAVKDDQRIIKRHAKAVKHRVRHRKHVVVTTTTATTTAKH
jgi:hypothetical protein